MWDAHPSSELKHEVLSTSPSLLTHTLSIEGAKKGVPMALAFLGLETQKGYRPAY